MEDKIIDTIKDIGNKLNEEYLRAGTKSKRRRILYELFAFEVLCEEEFGIENKHLWFVDKELLPDNKQYFDIINRDKKCFFNISKAVIESFISEKYPFYHEYHKSLPKMNKKQMMEIVLSFLNDIDRGTADKIINKSVNSKIIETNIYGAGGYINPFEAIDDSVIVINNEDGYNLEFARSLVHECGHLFELEHLYSQNKKVYRNASIMTPYYEVSSSFFEYAFLRYIKDNKILNHSIDVSLNDYYIELFINNFYMNVICMKDKIEDNDDCVYIEEERIKKYADNIMTRSNFYDMYYYTEGLDSKYSFIYPIGQFMAIYLYENYKQDKENFIKEFKRSFLIYPTNPTLEAFNKVGINYQELKEGKVLKRILNEYKTKF